MRSSVTELTCIKNKRSKGRRKVFNKTLCVFFDCLSVSQSLSFLFIFFMSRFEFHVSVSHR